MDDAMKFPLFALLFLIAVSPLLGDPTADQLVGHWQASAQGFVLDYTVKNDGTFTGSLAQAGKMLWTCAGKWTLSGKSLETQLTQSSAPAIPVGKKERKTVTELTANQCHLRTQTGTEEKYSRVP